eukprot:3118039-Rhodomonas_salina.2
MAAVDDVVSILLCAPWRENLRGLVFLLAQPRVPHLMKQERGRGRGSEKGERKTEERDFPRAGSCVLCLELAASDTEVFASRPFNASWQCLNPKGSR